MPRGRQPLSCVFLLIISVVLGLSGCRTDSQNPQAAGTPPTVQVAAVQRRDVALTSEWIATMDGYVNAQIQ